MSPSPDAFFRANAGLVVLNAQGEVLAVERSDQAGAWQLPQGGMDGEETPLQAAYRELEEETGLQAQDVSLLGEMPQWLVYELPPEWRRKKTGWGQAQKWFFFLHIPQPGRSWQVGPLPEGGENRAMAWKSLPDLAESVPEFRQPIYAALVDFLKAGLVPPPSRPRRFS